MDILTGTPTKTIRAIVADEQPAFGEGLRNLLRSERDIKVVGVAHDVPSAVELAAQLDIDILLLDFVLCQKCKVTEPDTYSHHLTQFRILMMVGNPKEADVVEAFCLGARGVVFKDSEARLWSKSIRKVVSEEYWLGKESAEILIKSLRALLLPSVEGARSQYFGLSRRELLIVDRVARGRSNKQVGIEFSICERTVKHHLTNIYNKLGISSRLALALFARDNHILLDPADQSVMKSARGGLM